MKRKVEGTRICHCIMDDLPRTVSIIKIKK
jgi:hypothetical protein